MRVGDQPHTFAAGRDRFSEHPCFIAVTLERDLPRDGRECVDIS